MNDSRKNKQFFVDIGKAPDLEVIFAKALKELPRRLLIVIPEWNERTFYDLHEYVLKDSLLFLMILILLLRVRKYLDFEFGFRGLGCMSRTL